MCVFNTINLDGERFKLYSVCVNQTCLDHLYLVPRQVSWSTGGSFGQKVKAMGKKKDRKSAAAANPENKSLMQTAAVGFLLAFTSVHLWPRGAAPVQGTVENYSAVPSNL